MNTFLFESPAERRQRRNRDIYVRFNELLPSGRKYQLIYEQIGYEFYLSDERIKKIVQKMTLARDKKSS